MSGIAEKGEKSGEIVRKWNPRKYVQCSGNVRLLFLQPFSMATSKPTKRIALAA